MSVELRVNLEEVLRKIIEVAKEVEVTNGTEEDLKIRVETILREHVWSRIGVSEPRYEVRVDVGTYAKSYGRIDALYGLTIFEYKRPNTLSRPEERDEAIRKLKDDYIPGLLRKNWVQSLVNAARRERLSPRVIGIVFDGYGVVFVEYHIETRGFHVEPEVGFYDLQSAEGVDYLRRIIRSVLATYRKKIDAKVLASDFGYSSSIAKKAVRRFYSKLVRPRSERTKMLFNEWLKEVSQAYPISGAELRRIAELYGFKSREIEKVDGVKLFFAIQTYYSLILKLLAAEVASRFYDSAVSMYIKKLMAIKRDPNALRRELEQLESGFVYELYGIRNFLEGEFFSWYLDEWDVNVYRVISKIIRKLNEYDVEAITLDMRSARDVFKMLYEELVPREEVRKKLGIYTTPDWLAELILDELGLTVEKFLEMARRGQDPLDLRILDPGVGTGTFLSLVIQRFGEYLKRRYGLLPSRVAKEALKKITRNVVGFDIDALAVLTARTNYLIALATTGLLEHKGGEPIEIPIYMANSVIAGEQPETQAFVEVRGERRPVNVLKVSTVAGDFLIPLRLVESGKALQLLSDLRERLKFGYSFDHVSVHRALDPYNLADDERQVVRELYDKLLELRSRGVDDVWIPIIKSYLIPTLFRGSFDYVVGNPPWIAYRHIADPDYQAKIKSLVKDYYELVRDENLITHMEMATLFFVRSIDFYLKDEGFIGFVMPRAVFSADQHDAFRRGSVSHVKYEFIEFIDCEKVSPLFYVPACAIIARKGGEARYPIDAIIVSGKLPEDGHKVIPLSEALVNKYLNIERGKKLYLNVIGPRSFLDYSEFRIHGIRSYYYKYFYQGATIVPQLCWFVDVVEASHPNFVIVQSSRRVGVRGHIKEKIGPLPVEREFIYGALSSAEVLPFCHLPPNIAVLPIRPARSGKGYEIIRKEVAFKMGYPYLAKWLEEAEKVWSKVRGEKEVDLYEWLDYQHKLSRQNPNAKYKVVYLRSGTHLAACVVEKKPLRVDNVELKGIIIESTLYRFETDNLDEAYYLVSILNSKVLDDLIKPLQSKGKYGERDIHKKLLEFPIPKFNPNDPIHRRLAELGRKASEEANRILPRLLAEFGYDEKLRERGTLMPQEVARLRQAIRDNLESILEEIDDLVGKLLSESVKSRETTGLGRWLKLGGDR